MASLPNNIADPPKRVKVVTHYYESSDIIALINGRLAEKKLIRDKDYLVKDLSGNTYKSGQETKEKKEVQERTEVKEKKESRFETYHQILKIKELIYKIKEKIN